MKYRSAITRKMAGWSGVETVEARPWSRHRVDASLVSVHGVMMGVEYGFGQFTVMSRIIQDHSTISR